jgi:hypothetical protein
MLRYHISTPSSGASSNTRTLNNLNPQHLNSSTLNNLNPQLLNPRLLNNLNPQLLNPQQSQPSTISTLNNLLSATKF